MHHLPSYLERQLIFVLFAFQQGLIKHISAMHAGAEQLRAELVMALPFYHSLIEQKNAICYVMVD